MANLLEMAAEIVASHASTTAMTTEQLIQEIQTVYNALKTMEAGQPIDKIAEDGKLSKLTAKQAFKKDEVICMVCSKGGFKTLKKHLATAHQMTPGQYRKQFGIKSTQKLAAKNFSEARRKAAEERGMSAVLERARATRMAKLKAKKSPQTAKPAAKPTTRPVRSTRLKK
ncbi:MAG: MucR family transcriptional regulator [Desulfuromonadales bacterium]|nr:MucR family transcriptional regulator [Desulfuromonadales bacterium]